MSKLTLDWYNRNSCGPAVRWIALFSVDWARHRVASTDQHAITMGTENRMAHATWDGARLSNNENGQNQAQAEYVEPLFGMIGSWIFRARYLPPWLLQDAKEPAPRAHGKGLRPPGVCHVSAMRWVDECGCQRRRPTLNGICELGCSCTIYIKKNYIKNDALETSPYDTSLS